MKILHVGKYYPPYRGGMETVLQNVAEGLLARDCEVSLVTAGDGVVDSCEIIGDREAGRRGRLVRAAIAGVVNSQPLTPTLVSVLRREIRRLQPDILHVHLPNPLAAAAWCVLRTERSLPCATAVWHHAEITRQRWGRLLVEPFQRACLDGAAGICVSSRALVGGSPMLAGRAGKTVVIPFGIEPQPWLDVDARRDGPLLFVGRLVPYKGLPVLLRAMATVPDLGLVLAGDGPQRAELQEQAFHLGMADRVEFAGSLDPQDIAHLLGHARALVLPSVDASEAFGLVQLEAMAAGVPVVTTDLPTGVREVGIVEETCLQVTPGDVPALSRALQRLQGSDDLARRMGEAGRRRFLEHFTRDRMIDSLLSWYESLLGRNDATRMPA